MSWVPNVSMSVAPGPDDTRQRPERVAAVPITSINPGERRRPLDPVKVQELTESIRRHGLLQPIGVRRVPSTKGKFATGYDLVYGHHRLAAMLALFDEGTSGADNVAAVIYPADMPADAMALDEIVENLHRKELTPAEKAAHVALYAAMLKRMGLVEARRSKQGKSKSRLKKHSVNVTEHYINLPTVTEAIGHNLGLNRERIVKRIATAVELAKRDGVTVANKTVETMNSEELDRIGNAALLAATRERDTATATKVGKLTERKITLDTVDLARVLPAWCRRALAYPSHPLTLPVLKATRDALDALIAEMERRI
jgi:ParB/RepB/Spo0J family partition protein